MDVQEVQVPVEIEKIVERIVEKVVIDKEDTTKLVSSFPPFRRILQSW